MATLIMILVIVFFPRIIMLVSEKLSFLKTVGPVFICYLTGFY